MLEVAQEQGRREIGGRPLGRGQLHYLLTNPVYRGRTRHGGVDHDGRHPAIIDENQWRRVQQSLQSRAGRSRGRGEAPDTAKAVLVGRLTDETGDRLTPTYTVKGLRRYRYYVSNRLISGLPDPTGWRIPAATLEQGLADAVRNHLRRLIDDHRVLAVPDLGLQETLRSRIVDIAGDADHRSDRTHQLLGLLKSGTLGRNRIQLVLSPDPLATVLGVSSEQIAEDALMIDCPAALRRRGVEARLVIGDRARQPDPKLVSAGGRAHRWLRELRIGRDIGSLARGDGISEGCLRVRLQLLSSRLPFRLPSSTAASRRRSPSIA